MFNGWRTTCDNIYFAHGIIEWLTVNGYEFFGQSTMDAQMGWISREQFSAANDYKWY